MSQRNKALRVLVGCEFSGVVRRAFRALGHDAVSCDLIDAEDSQLHHLKADVFDVVNSPRKYGRFDLAVFHPPCTFLANSGVRWLYGGKGTTRDPVRWAAMEEAAVFFRALLDCYIPRVAIENPIMHRYARELIGRGPDCIVQPWMFGHPETKATCFWLLGLPPLEPTKVVEGRKPRVHHESPGPDRWKRRSRFLPGMAAAMAAQWAGKVSG